MKIILRMLFFPHVLSVRQQRCKCPRIRLVSIISVLCFHLKGSYIIQDKNPILSTCYSIFTVALIDALLSLSILVLEGLTLLPCYLFEELLDSQVTTTSTIPTQISSEFSKSL